MTVSPTTALAEVARGGRPGPDVVDHEPSRHALQALARRSSDRPRADRLRVAWSARLCPYLVAMRALRSFTVRARLPEALGPLQELAFNLRWSWDDRTRDLFRWVDPADLGADVPRPGPAARPGRPATARAAGRRPRLHGVPRARCTTTCAATWRRRGGSRTAPPSPLRGVAYFSPEFGIAEALPQYSGGLGVLAGDHLKAASGLGVPLVGVGLIYRHGLLPPAPRRRRLAGGALPDPRPARHGAGAGRGRPRRRSTWPARRWSAQVWRAASAGCGCTCSTPTSTTTTTICGPVTDRLYGGDTEHRIRQEILLGIGGVRALEAVGVETQVFHTNEGHAGFLGLERIRQLIVDEGLQLRRGGRGGPGRHRLHHPHARCRPGIDRFPTGADGAVLRAAGPTSAASSIDTAHGARPLSRARRPTSRSTWR